MLHNICTTSRLISGGEMLYHYLKLKTKSIVPKCKSCETPNIRHYTSNYRHKSPIAERANLLFYWYFVCKWPGQCHTQSGHAVNWRQKSRSPISKSTLPNQRPSKDLQFTVGYLTQSFAVKPRNEAPLPISRLHVLLLSFTHGQVWFYKTTCR